MPHQPILLTSESVRSWLSDRVASYTDRPVATVAADAPITEYGLDSVSALELCAEIEDRYGVRVEPVDLWDHPTVAALGALVADRAGARDSVADV